MDTFTLLAIIINYNLDDAEYSDEGERSYITIIKVKIESYGNSGLRRFEKIHAVGLHKTFTCNDIYKQVVRQTMNKIKNKMHIFFAVTIERYCGNVKKCNLLHDDPAME